VQYRATEAFIGGRSKILPALQRPAFLEAFHDKPPMQELLANIPVRVVLDARLGLYGAAGAAYRTEMETTRSS
jgi:glucokinase